MRQAPVVFGGTAVSACHAEPSLTTASALIGTRDGSLTCSQAYGWESTSNRAAAVTWQRRACICSADSDMIIAPSRNWTGIKSREGGLNKEFVDVGSKAPERGRHVRFVPKADVASISLARLRPHRGGPFNLIAQRRRNAEHDLF